VLWIDDATVVEGDPRLDAPLAAAEAAIRGTSESSDLRLQPLDVARGALSVVEGQADAVRTMYKRVGLDPTKRRPSSEALLRRVRKGEPLPRINSMVDVCNWCSLEFQLPYGLYDAAHINGDVVLRLGLEGESYPGIRKDEVHVGGRITLADSAGPFGNPTSDSARTMVTTNTTHALLVVFAPVQIDTARLLHVLEHTAARMREFTGGTPRALSTAEVTHERRRAQGQD
jgi:DNA/RNA-binding domain of Phe-tRNA-synthetase-like protein